MKLRIATFSSVVAVVLTVAVGCHEGREPRQGMEAVDAGGELNGVFEPKGSGASSLWLGSGTIALCYYESLSFLVVLMDSDITASSASGTIYEEQVHLWEWGNPTVLVFSAAGGDAIRVDRVAGIEKIEITEFADVVKCSLWSDEFSISEGNVFVVERVEEGDLRVRQLEGLLRIDAKWDIRNPDHHDPDDILRICRARFPDEPSFRLLE